MSKIIDTGYVEIRPQLARNFTADATAQAAPAVAALQRDFDKSASIVSSSNAKVQASTLRVTAAQERLNALRTQGVTDTAKLASAEATLISSQDRLATLQRRSTSGAQPLREQVRGTQSLAIGLAGLASGAYILRELAHGYVQGAQAASQLSLAQAQSERSVARLGAASNITTGTIEKQATAAAQAGIATDTQATAAQNLLLTYSALTDRGTQFFDRSLHAVENLATFSANLRGTQVDLVGTAKAVGVALQDPAAGVQRLSRLGIRFTAEQAAGIKDLVKNGQLAAAQGRIVELIEGKVAGAAQTFENSTAGSLQRSQISFEEFQRSLTTDVLPGVTRGLNDVTSALNFLGAHSNIRQPIEAAVLGAGGLYALSRTVKIVRDVRDTLRPLRTAEAVSQNNLVATSYGRIAAEATAAAEAEILAARSGGRVPLPIPGGTTGGTVAAEAGAAGVLGGGLRLLRTPVGRFAGTAFVLSSAFHDVSAGPSDFRYGERLSQGNVGVSEFLHGFLNLRNFSPTTAAGAIGGFGNYFNRTPAPVEAPGVLERSNPLISRLLSLDEQRTALDKRVAADNRAIGRAERTAAPTGLFDALPAKPTVDLAGLSDRVANAQGRVANAQDRLNALRKTGKATTEQLASAERSLASAQRSADAAQRALADGQKKANANTALSVTDVLKRANVNADTAASQVRAERRLLREGLSVGAVKELETVEAQNKGTIQRLAKNLTQTQIDQLDKDAAKRAKAVGDMSAIDKLSDRDKGLIALRRLGREQATAQLEGYRRALAGWRPGIPGGPTGPTANRPSGLGGLLLPPGVTVNNNYYGPVHDPRAADSYRRRRTQQGALTGSGPKASLD